MAGLVTVAAKRTLPGTHRVYNLTVQGEHLYRVATSGVLVHNNCDDELVEVWRIVEKSELQDIIRRGNRYHAPPQTLSPTGKPGKWFYGSRADALDTAKAWSESSGIEFFLTRTRVRKSALADVFHGIDNTPTMPLGKDGFFVRIEELIDAVVEIIE